MLEATSIGILGMRPGSSECPIMRGDEDWTEKIPGIFTGIWDIFFPAPEGGQYPTTPAAPPTPGTPPVEDEGKIDIFGIKLSPIVLILIVLVVLFLFMSRK